MNLITLLYRIKLMLLGRNFIISWITSEQQGLATA